MPGLIRCKNEIFNYLDGIKEIIYAMDHKHLTKSQFCLQTYIYIAREYLHKFKVDSIKPIQTKFYDQHRTGIDQLFGFRIRICTNLFPSILFASKSLICVSVNLCFMIWNFRMFLFECLILSPIGMQSNNNSQ